MNTKKIILAILTIVIVITLIIVNNNSNRYIPIQYQKSLSISDSIINEIECEINTLQEIAMKTNDIHLLKEIEDDLYIYEAHKLGLEYERDLLQTILVREDSISYVVDSLKKNNFIVY